MLHMYVPIYVCNNNKEVMNLKGSPGYESVGRGEDGVEMNNTHV